MEIRELELIEISEDGDWEESSPGEEESGFRKEKGRKSKKGGKHSKNTGSSREAADRRGRRSNEDRKLRRRRRNRRIRLIRTLLLLIPSAAAAALLLIVIKLAHAELQGTAGTNAVQTVTEVLEQEDDSGRNRRWKDFYAAELERPRLDVQLLTVNEYSRPGELLPEVKNIFVHYTANAGTTALQNRSYFESLAETHERSASAHFVIGYDGEVVQCIPTKEIAYAVMQRNYDSISIECCYLEESGRFTQETYDSLIALTAWLLHKYQLSPEDVLRHYDEGGKNCPKYYVENEEEWQRFLQNLTTYMEKVSKEKEL